MSGPVAVPSDVADAITAALANEIGGVSYPDAALDSAVWNPWPVLAGARGTGALIQANLTGTIVPSAGLLIRRTFAPDGTSEGERYYELGSKATTFERLDAAGDPETDPIGTAPFGRYTFSTSTSSGDPGSGNLRLDQAVQSDATVIRVSTTDADSDDLAATLDSITAALANQLVFAYLIGGTHLDQALVFLVAGVTSHSGYREIQLGPYVGGGYASWSGAGTDASPIADAHTVVVQFPGI
jgi:hypothetical protein